VEAFGPGSVDDYVGDGEDFEEETHALVLVAGGAEQALGVEDERVGVRVVGAPDAHCAGFLFV